MDVAVDPPKLRARSAREHRAARLAPMLLALAVLAGAASVIAGAFAFQFAGYLPCELCLKERQPFYLGIALAAATLVPAWRGPRWLAAAGFAALTLVFVGSTAFGAYHAGVEWGFWPGPSDCSGTLSRATSNADFLHQLQGFRAVRCDAVAIRILGLSLAGWNAAVSACLAGLALAGVAQARR